MENLNQVDILIIEDDLHDAEVVIRALRRSNPLSNIHFVMEGSEALDNILCRGKFKKRTEEISPKFVLLDLKLSKVTRLEILKTLKSDKRFCHIPVITIISSKEAHDIREAYSLGANSCIVKPISNDLFEFQLSRIGNYWLHVNEAPCQEQEVFDYFFE